MKLILDYELHAMQAKQVQSLIGLLIILVNFVKY